MRLLYPADTFAPKTVDEVYTEEYAAAQAAGFDVSIFSFEDFQSGSFRPRSAVQGGETVLYRGWMMPPAEYALLYESILASGATPVTNVSQFTLCHHLPQWHALLSEFTAETRIYPEDANVEADLKAAGWDSCFLKDYVKSLSTDGGSLVLDLSNIPTVVAKMRKYRGQIEGGLCARRVERYDSSSEQRCFVWHGRAFSDAGEVPAAVAEAARRIHSPFFSVDLARRDDGVLRIVELGDGQVSDRKHWSCDRFISMLAAAV